MDAVRQSLGRLQERLEEDSSLAATVWNHPGKKNARPKLEADIRELLIRHLNHELRESRCIVNREVSYPSGERTDILIEAIAKDSPANSDRLALVIIEVKGPWNVGDSLKSQLRDRYLTKYGTDQGIFLVAWFDLTRWDIKDRNRAKVKWKTSQELQSYLEEGASKLSSEQIHIESVVLKVPCKQPR